MFLAAASKFPTCWQVDWLVRYVCYICSGMIYGINGTIIRYCFCCTGNWESESIGSAHCDCSISIALMQYSKGHSVVTIKTQ